MNVDEAMELFGPSKKKFYTLQSGDHFCAGETLACEVERLRAELTVERAAVKSLGKSFDKLRDELWETKVEDAHWEESYEAMSDNNQDGEQIAIRGMSHFYGDLWIFHDGDEYFWLLSDYNGGEWQPIPKQLYDALLEHNGRAEEVDKTPPQS